MPWVRYIPPEMKAGKKNTPLSQNANTRVTGGTTGDCMNTPVIINALRTGAIVKVPVVLAELELQLNIDAVIDLPEPALKIKDMKKNIKINECLLLQDTNILFLKGCIQKNIQYTTDNLYSSHGVSEEFRHCTAEIPFGCTTPVTFNGSSQILPIPSSSRKFEYSNKQDDHFLGNVEKNCLQGNSFHYNQISTEYFNELPYCELVSSRIVEYDKYLNFMYINKLDASFGERPFKSIEKKMAVYLTVKILQKRQVTIPPMALCAVPDEDS